MFLKSRTKLFHCFHYFSNFSKSSPQSMKDKAKMHFNDTFCNSKKNHLGSSTDMPKGHSAMDKALACHTGGQCLKPGWNQRFFNSEKIIGAPIILYTPAASLPMTWSNPWNRWLVTGEVKEGNGNKNPSSAICDVNTDIRAMYGRRIVLKSLLNMKVLLYVMST